MGDDDDDIEDGDEDEDEGRSMALRGFLISGKPGDEKSLLGCLRMYAQDLGPS